MSSRSLSVLLTVALSLLFATPLAAQEEPPIEGAVESVEAVETVVDSSDQLEKEQLEQAQRTQAAPRYPHRAPRASVDYSTALIQNVPRRATEFTGGFRIGVPVWYSRLFWRFQFGLRGSAQFNISPRINAYPYLGLEGGFRFIIFSFLSFETYVGPRLGLQFGQDQTVLVSGVGGTGAWLFHPWRDNRRRLRLGAELYNIHPLTQDPTPLPGWLRYRHIGGFLGYETAF